MSPKPTDRAERLRQAILLRQARPEAAPALARRPESVPPRLSGLQQGIWLAQRLDPASPAYNMVSAFEVADGVVDPSRLDDGFAAVQRRHRILRTTLRTSSSQVRPQFAAEPLARLERLVVEHGGVAARAEQEARRPFDLEREAPLRLLLVDDGAQTWIVLVVHHLVGDEASLEILWRDLGAAASGAALDPPAAQYDDWAYANADHRLEPDSVAYYEQELDPPPDDAAWQMGAIATPAASSAGAHLTLDLQPRLVQEVGALAAAKATTPFGVYALAYELLLRAHAEGDCIFATTVSLRDRGALTDVIGYLLNVVPVRPRLQASMRLGEALDAVTDALRRARPHAAAPLQGVLDEVGVVRDSARHPLYQSLFVLQTPPAPPALEGVQLVPRFVDAGSAKFELTVFVSEGNEDGAVPPQLGAEYRTALFEAGAVEKLLARYASLLQELVDRAADDPPLREVSGLLADERQTVATWSRGPALADADGPLLPPQIAATAEERAGELAVRSGGRSVSYGDLAASAREVARRLREAGATRGERVGVLVERSPELLVAILGCHWAGAAYVPLDPNAPQARHVQVAQDADVCAVLVSPTTREASALEVPLLEVHAPSMTGSAVASAECAPEDAAYVLYTSGSTGRPKGVVVSHGNLRASTAARAEVYPEPPERFLLLSSAGFDSSVAGIFWTLSTGGTLVVPTEDEMLDPRRLAELCSRERVTTLLCVPALWEQMLERGPFDALRTVIVAGEACPAALVERHQEHLPGVRLVNEYGPTEASVWCTSEVLVEPGWRQEPPRDPITIGRPIAGVEVYACDALERPVAPGFAGTAWVRGPTVAQGYWRAPDATARSFGETQGARTYCTGDRVRWNESGSLVFLGRADDQVKVRGHRIELGEVESALSSLPGVAEAAVVVRGAPRSGHLAAFVTGAGRVDSAELREMIASRLPEPMVPARVLVLDELPRLTNGKVDRVALAARTDDQAEQAETPWLPLESALATFWESLLEAPVTRADVNFFELGGHSLLVAMMADLIEQDLGVRLEPAEIFERPTIRELAARIERSQPATPPYEHLFPLQPVGSRTPFVMAIPHFFAETLNDHFRSERPVYGLRGVGVRAEGNRGRWRTMEQLGDELASEVQRRFGQAPVDLGGYSFGASMAFAAATALERAGVEVRRLVLIAPMALDVARFGPLRAQVEGLRAPLSTYSSADLRALWWRTYGPPFRRLLRAAVWHGVTQPWRRVLCRVGSLHRAAGRPLPPRIQHADVRLERFRLHRAFRPGTVSCPVVVLNPEVGPGETDAAATWAPHFAGPVDIRPTPDPHHGEAEVVETRRLLRECLQELD